MNDYDDNHREEEAQERAFERNTRRTSCQCGTDLPGSCPGPNNCPNHGEENEGGEE